ncbi:hypothetical protein AB0A69_00845 [Streptomyces sp. NPDC045431]|uniref:hypothetical protein n=1 Tax=Streptomyces sp. NPDC045431 TaxID=3155613 RepID=UPI0033EE96E9
MTWFHRIVALALYLFALVVMSFSFMGTVEMESFPGLRQNDTFAVIVMGVFAVVVAGAALVLAGYRSRLAQAATACVVLLLAWRVYTLGPVLHCWNHNSVGRGDDGTYTCYDL